MAPSGADLVSDVEPATASGLAVCLDCEPALADAVQARLAAVALPSWHVVARPQQAHVVVSDPGDLAARRRAAEAGHAARLGILRHGLAGSDAAEDPNRPATGAPDVVLPLDAPAAAWQAALPLLATVAALRAELTATKLAYREAVRHGGLGRWSWNLASGALHLDAGWKAMLGYTAEEVVDDAPAWFARVQGPDRPRLRAALEPLLTGQGREMAIELRIQHRDRSFLWVRCEATRRLDDGVPMVVGTQRDITAQKLADVRAAVADRVDRLTGTLRREAFLAELAARLEDPAPFALGLCDVDDCKLLNRRWGRRAGDDVLVWLAGLLEDRLGVGSLCGRIAGDAFAFVLEGDDLIAHASTLAAMREELRAERFVAEQGVPFEATAAFALAMRPAGHISADGLLQWTSAGIERARASGEGLLVVTAETAALAFAPTDRGGARSTRG